MNRSIIIAAAIALLAVLWMLSGMFRDDAPETPDPAMAGTAEGQSLFKVQTAAFTAETRPQLVVLRGRTESKRTVTLVAEIDGAITGHLKEKGERVAKGEPIARLNVMDREARRLQAQALVKQREIEYAAADKLSKAGHKSDTALAAAGAQLDSARAMLKRIQVELSQMTVRAPFDGVIADRHAEIGAYLKSGDPVATVIDQDPILIIGQSAERDVGKLTIGSEARVRLSDGSQITGRISYISPVAEKATRTFRVEVEAPNPDYAIRDGITAELMLNGGMAQAHLVSPAILTLDDSGRIGVRALEETGKARFLPVGIVSEGSDGLWVTGLPPRVHLIVVGQEFVADGQTVEAMKAKN